MTTLGDKAFEKAMRMAMPTGTMLPFAGTTVPEGWLLCNGANVSRTVYANLFAAIGTRWGSGDGSTTFTLPNCDSRFLEGTTDASKVGTYLEAGLPNITGYEVAWASTISGMVAPFNRAGYGAFYANSGSTAMADASGTARKPTEGDTPRLYLSAKNSDSAYGNASTVQPKSAQALMIIKV